MDNSDHETLIELELPYIQFYARTHASLSHFTASIEQNLNFRIEYHHRSSSVVVETPRLQQREPWRPHQLAYVSLNAASTNLPNSLLLDHLSTTTNNKKIIKRTPSSSPSSWLISSIKYRVVSNVLILATTTAGNETRRAREIVVEFVLTNNFESHYEPRDNSIQYRQLKTVKSDYRCVRLNAAAKSWSTRRSRLLAYDPQNNLLKCWFDLSLDDDKEEEEQQADNQEQASSVGIIVGVVLPHGSFNSASSTPISFSIASRLIGPLALAILAFTTFALVLLKVCGNCPKLELYVVVVCHSSSDYF